jgi:hypothetical protein
MNGRESERDQKVNNLFQTKYVSNLDSTILKLLRKIAWVFITGQLLNI